MEEHTHWNAWRIPRFRWRPAAIWNFRPSPCFRDKKKSEAISAFCHWRGHRPRQLSLNSCGPPPTVLWGCLFLNKWVYDSDFLLPLPSLSLIWNSTHPSEREQSGCCLCLLSPCATWLAEGGGLRGHILHMKSPVATPMLSRALDLCSNSPLESLLRVNEFSGSPPLTVMVIVCPGRIFK